MPDTLSARFARLEPHIRAYGPEDDAPRPAILLFHGCGGIRPHLQAYAETAVKSGLRAFVVDSLAPRGLGRAAAISLVCTGLILKGYERSGDVLAALWGLSNRSDVITDQILLAGWSHGGWSIMDLMTQPLIASGEARLKDPDASLMERVKGLFLVYPYIGFPALSVTQDWRHKPDTYAVLAKRDHLSPPHHAAAVFDRLRTANVPLTVLDLDATHAFDEETYGKGVMAYDAAATTACHEALKAFIAERF